MRRPKTYAERLVLVESHMQRAHICAFLRDDGTPNWSVALRRMNAAARRGKERARLAKEARLAARANPPESNPEGGNL